MATRLTGLRSEHGLGRTGATVLGTVRSWTRVKKAVFGGVLLLMVLAACSSTTTYPIDFFSAMHYQHSFRTLEPPRFLSPEGAVPQQGRAPSFTTEQILQLQNPVEADEASIAIGQQVYDVNCAVCHGGDGNGNGPMAEYLVNNEARPPADLTAERLVNVEDNHFYNVVTNGLPPYMPAFGNLIQGENIWHLVNYIRELQGGAS